MRLAIASLKMNKKRATNQVARFLLLSAFGCLQMISGHFYLMTLGHVEFYRDSIMDLTLSFSVFIDFDSQSSCCVFVRIFFLDVLDLLFVDLVIFKATCPALDKQFFMALRGSKAQLDVG